MTSISWTHSYSKTVLLEGITHLQLPTRYHHQLYSPPAFPPSHPLIRAIHDITVVVKKVAFLEV